jgi:hypothetical protein
MVTTGNLPWLKNPPFTYIYIYMCVCIFYEIPVRVILYPEVNIRDCRLEMPKSSGKDMAIKFYLEKRVATASIRQRLVVFHVRGMSLIWTLHEGYKFDMWNEDWSDCTPFCHSGARSHVVFSSPRWATQNLASRWCNGYTSDAVEKKVQRHGSKRPINLSTKEKSPELSALCRAKRI